MLTSHVFLIPLSSRPHCCLKYKTDEYIKTTNFSDNKNYRTRYNFLYAVTFEGLPETYALINMNVSQGRNEINPDSPF